MLESQVRENQSMAKMKWFKTQVDEMCFKFNLEYRYAVLSRGMQCWLFDSVKRAHSDPWEDPERKPLRTNIEILEWSSLDLMDQVESCKQGFGLLLPRPVCTDRATASFWEWGIYTPQPSPLRAAGSLHSSELIEAFSWPAISPQHSLWVVLNRLHILGLGWEIECVWAKWPWWAAFRAAESIHSLSTLDSVKDSSLHLLLLKELEIYLISPAETLHQVTFELEWKRGETPISDRFCIGLVYTTSLTGCLLYSTAKSLTGLTNRSVY